MKPELAYGNHEVLKEAKKRKKGGRAEFKAGGAATTPRLDRATGGRIGRNTGGGCETHPFSSAGSFERAGPRSKSGV